MTSRGKTSNRSSHQSAAKVEPRDSNSLDHLSSEIHQPIEVRLAEPSKFRRAVEVLTLFAVLVSSFAAATAAYYSASQTSYAADQARLNRQIPFVTERYIAKINALQSYSNAYGKFDNIFRLALVDLPWDITDSADLMKFSNAMMVENAKVSRRVLEAYAEYIAAIRTNVVTLWSINTQIEIKLAADYSKKSAECFILLGQHIDPQGDAYWNEVRVAATRECRNINGHEKHQAFLEASEAAMNAMSDEIKYTQAELDNLKH